MRLIIFLLVFISIGVNAQDLIVPKTGDPIKAYHLEVSDKYYFYTLSPQSNGEILKIEKENVLIVRKADGTTVSESSHEKEGTSENNFPVINEEDIHGSLIAQGNCVYIPTNSAFSYERAGQTKLKELVSGWGYWTVVDKPEKAHFILQYVTDTRAFPDMSYLLIRPRKYYREKPSLSPDDLNCPPQKSRNGIFVCYSNTSEDPGKNAGIAEKMFQNFKEILMDRNNKRSVKFFKCYSNALNSEASETEINNSSSASFRVR